MSYETKALFIALAAIIKETKDIRKVYGYLQKMANTDGIIIEDFEE